MLEYITKYDTVHGTFEGDVKVENGFLKWGKSMQNFIQQEMQKSYLSQKIVELKLF